MDETYIAARAAATKAATLAGSFAPGRRSTPLATSTPSGWVARMPAATLSGVSPPASTNGRRAARAMTGHGAATPPPPNPSTKASYSHSAGDHAAGGGNRSFVADPHRLDQAARVQSGVVGGLLVAVELRAIEAQLVERARDRRRPAALTNTPTFSTPGGTAASTDRAACRPDVALRARPQVDADGPCPGLDRHRRVVRRGDAADLDQQRHLSRPAPSARRPGRARASASRPPASRRRRPPAAGRRRRRRGSPTRRR